MIRRLLILLMVLLALSFAVSREATGQGGRNSGPACMPSGQCSGSSRLASDKEGPQCLHEDGFYACPPSEVLCQGDVQTDCQPPAGVGFTDDQDTEPPTIIYPKSAK